MCILHVLYAATECFTYCRKSILHLLKHMFNVQICGSIRSTLYLVTAAGVAPGIVHAVAVDTEAGLQHALVLILALARPNISVADLHSVTSFKSRYIGLRGLRTHDITLQGISFDVSASQDP